MEYKDYYKLMGVERDAKQADIKRAYRKLARKYHPDVSSESDAEEHFKEVNEAYEVLKDPEKRAAFDQLGQSWKQGEDFRPPPDWDAGFEFSGGGYTGADAAAFSDFFESLYGRASAQGGFHGAQHVAGEDHHARVLIDLENSWHGAQQAITLKVPQVDPSGHVITQSRTLNVRIPKGVKEGQRIRLKGQGAASIGGGPSGDLYLEIEFKPHKLYKVDGKDIYLDVPLAPWEAALGTQLEVPTPSGKVEMKIPENTRSGSKMRLKGRGIPAREAGDLYVITKIVLPEADTDDKRELYHQMQQTMGFNPRKAWGV